MTSFQHKAVTLIERQDKPDWLGSLHEAGLRQWSDAPWPTRRTEHWKYTPLKPLEKRGITALADGEPEAAAVAPVDWGERPVVRLVFVNGRFSAALSDSGDWPEGVSLFSQASAAQRETIRAHLGQHVDTQRHLFAALSNAGVSEGVLVHVPRGQRLKPVVSIEYIATPTSEPGVSQVRCLVVLDDQAEASVVEHFHSTADEQNGLVNALTELVVGDGARLQHTRLNLEQENLLHVGGVHADIGASGSLTGFALATGSPLKRIDYQVNHRGQGSELTLNGIYLPRHQQLVDFHTTVDHCVPHGTTRETFRGIIADRARAVFNGRIHIHPQAQKTLAELNNRNLLASPKAEVDTKPELEIYADDVQCAHGATVSQLDDTARYYMQSRGVPAERADAMLSFGFINEVLDDAPEAALQAYLRRHLAAWLGQSRDDLGGQE